MAIKDENDLISNGITSVKLISEGGSYPRLLIQLKDGEVLRKEIEGNFGNLSKDELDLIVEKMMDKRKRREKILKIQSKL